jgi:N-acetylglucosaminyl-diphospho-decaprenol L-rhamnosyltransferase
VIREMDVLPIPFQADEPVDVSVVVVNYNTGHLLEQMFAALEAARGRLHLQVIIVDNASRDGSAEIVRKRCPGVELIENSTNLGFARANNLALPRVRGRYILLLNTDALVASDTLQKTVEFMDAHPEYGVLGVKLVGPDGKLQPSCRYFPTPWNLFVISNRIGEWLSRRFFPGTRLVDDMSWDHASVRECDWVPGCYYLVRREVIDRVGLFDPRFFLYYEEVDHCRAVRQAGWRVIYYPFTQVVHIGGESAKSEPLLTQSAGQILPLHIESQLLYFRKHYGAIGVLVAVFLATLGNVITACGGLARQRDDARRAAAARHAWTMFKLLIDTSLASRATR